MGIQEYNNWENFEHNVCVTIPKLYFYLIVYPTLSSSTFDLSVVLTANSMHRPIDSPKLTSELLGFNIPAEPFALFAILGKWVWLFHAHMPHPVPHSSKILAATLPSTNLITVTYTNTR